VVEFLLENGAKVDSQDDGEHVYMYVLSIIACEFVSK
jgi:hypothetical protein